MPGTYVISSEAQVKISLHAAKYPYANTLGVLVGTDNGNQAYDITDAFPISHHAPTLPLLTMALSFIEASFDNDDNVKVVGVFFARGIKNNSTTLPSVVASFADSIEKLTTRACVLECQDASLSLFLKDVKRGWIPTPSSYIDLIDGTSNAEMISAAQIDGAQFELYDFEDHFENIQKDWRNPSVHEILKMNL